MTQSTLNQCLAAVKASMKRNGRTAPTSEDWNAGYRRHLAITGKSGRSKEYPDAEIKIQWNGYWYIDADMTP